jgi:cold shock CspA family protein
MKLIGVMEYFNREKGFGFVRHEPDTRTAQHYWLHVSKIVSGKEHAQKGARVFFEVDPSYVVPASGRRYPWAYRAVVDSAFAAGAAALATGLPSEDSDEQ